MAAATGSTRKTRLSYCHTTTEISVGSVAGNKLEAKSSTLGQQNQLDHSSEYMYFWCLTLHWLHTGHNWISLEIWPFCSRHRPRGWRNILNRRSWIFFFQISLVLRRKFYHRATYATVEEWYISIYCILFTDLEITWLVCLLLQKASPSPSNLFASVRKNRKFTL